MRPGHALALAAAAGAVAWMLLVGAGKGAGHAPRAAGPPAEPVLFAPGVVSTVDDESGGSFSPDGTEYYFAKIAPYTAYPRLAVLCVSRFGNGRWNAPEVLPFSGRALDLTPRMSPDGHTL